METKGIVWRLKELMHIKHLRRFQACAEQVRAVSLLFLLQHSGQLVSQWNKFQRHSLHTTWKKSENVSSCDPMVCSPPGSSAHGLLQAGILDWVAIPFSRGSLWPRNWIWVSCIAGRFFTTEPAGKLPSHQIKTQLLNLAFVLCCLLPTYFTNSFSIRLQHTPPTGKSW